MAVVQTAESGMRSAKVIGAAAAAVGSPREHGLEHCVVCQIDNEAFGRYPERSVDAGRIPYPIDDVYREELFTKQCAERKKQFPFPCWRPRLTNAVRPAAIAAPPQYQEHRRHVCM